MKCVTAKFVAKLLNFKQKQSYISVAQELLNKLKGPLASCDTYLFPKLKKPMKEKRFATIDEI